MNQEPLPDTTPAETGSPKAIKKGGCASFLVVAFGALLLVYILVFQTSIPVKLIAKGLCDGAMVDGRPVTIKGVGGSLSRGISIKEMIIPGAAGDTRITGLKFKYRKPLRWFTRAEFTFTEISSTSAELVVASDFFSGGDEPSQESGQTQDGETTAQQTTAGQWNGFFDLQLLKFQNTRIRNADNSVDIRIPEIYMKGLYIDNDGMRIDDFRIESDMLKAGLSKGRSATIEGEKVAFNERIDIVVRPGIHRSVIKEIPLSFEFSRSKGLTTSRITAFDGSMEQVAFGDQRSLVRFASLKPLEYLKIDDQVIPNEFNLVARHRGELVTLEPGSFVIGITTFHFDGREFQANADEVIVGKTNSGPYEITANIHPDKSDKAWPPILVELSSKPEAPKNEILAQLYHGKDYGSLGAEEKARIDKLQP